MVYLSACDIIAVWLLNLLLFQLPSNRSLFNYYCYTMNICRTSGPTACSKTRILDNMCLTGRRKTSMTRPRQPQTCSHPTYAQKLTVVYQVFRNFSLLFFMHLYPGGSDRVTCWCNALYYAHVSPTVAVEKLTKGSTGINKYMRSNLFLLYNSVNFVMKNNVVMKILDFQNDDTWRL